MRQIIRYIGRYFYETDKRVLGLASLFTAILIFINYHFKLDRYIGSQQSFIIRMLIRFFIFFIAFSFPYLLYALLNKKKYFQQPLFLFLLFLAPLLFALKIVLDFSFFASSNEAINDYWNQVIYWPLLLLIIGVIIFIYWKIVDRHQPLYGLTTKNLEWKPYFLMLLIMLPLIAAAATQPDFLHTYPKLKNILDNSMELQWWHKILFELSYGSDFITIEFFFRGFLILAFIKWAGKDAILPMACFYCTIHFGKPLAECISSYFGGMLLGIVVYHTRSVYGGLIVHLGIAWLMELGGYLGNLVRL